MAQQNLHDPYDFFAKPYKNLGQEIRKIRTAQKRTVLDVSSAVELNPTSLSRIESGQIRPTQETINLLINHFDLAEDDANRLWQLAGYEQQLSLGTDISSTEPQLDNYIDSILGNSSKQIVMAVNDQRIVYTDVIHVRVNNHGVVVSFLQGAGDSQPSLINRFGMSLEHARSLVRELGQAIERHQASEAEADELD